METVKTHCKHIDCKYRGRFDSQPACVYMAVTGRPRGCSISECDKYSPGKLRTVSKLGGFIYEDEEGEEEEYYGSTHLGI